MVSIFDEVSFWMDDRSARPDWETYRAVRPSMATLPESMLIGISTPGKKAGLLYDKYRKHFGVDDDDVLVIKAATSVLNRMVDAATIAKDYEDDPQVAAAERASAGACAKCCRRRGAFNILGSPIHRADQATR